MLIELLIGGAGFVLLYVLVEVAINLFQQYQVNQFFKINSPGLPFLGELLSLYGGHLRTIIYEHYNCELVQQLHAKHGETFGILFNKTPFISTIDLDFIKTIAIDDPYHHIDRPDADLFLDEFEVDSIPFAKGKQWHKLRQASAPALTNHKIKTANVTSEIQEIIHKFVASLERRLDAAKSGKGEERIVEDIDDILQRYSFALVFKCFYKQDNKINFDTKKDFYVDLMARSVEVAAVRPFLILCVVFPSFRPILKWLLLRFHPQGILRRNIMMFIRQQTKQNLDARNEFESAKKNAIGTFDPDNYYLKDGSKFSRNLSDHLIDQFHEGKLTKREYFNTAFFTFFAASKTSADALSILIYNLSLNAQVQEKLRESILRDGLESEYLTWCINEALRLYPPAPSGCSRIVTSEFVTKAGYKIPANVPIHTPAYTIHRLKEYWGEDSDKFRPERWSNSKNFHPCQFLAFGAGKRNCPGKYFAMHEMKMLMDVLLRKFRFQSCHKTTDNNRFRSPAFVFIVFDEPHYVEISRL